MRPWVLRWGSNVEVIAPASLREYVATTLRKAAAQYR
jgi:predicted DNA-binding transcriptional regulator YafY